MKKVGIMSMQRIANYGSFLQAYGLKQILSELGCEVEFVDYHVEPCLISNEQRGFGRKVKKVLEVFKYNAPLKDKINFIKHKKNYAGNNYPLLGLTEEMNYTPELDLLVIGSDEVFNCVQSNSNVGFSPELFGVNNRAKKLISYAASFGNTTKEKLVKYEVENQIREWLGKFSAISVRDNNSGSIVSDLLHSTPEYHLDPVLIYDYVGKCKDIPDTVKETKYLILYGYSGRLSKEECEIVKRYAKNKGLQVFCIGGIQECSDKFIECNPFEVISYFKNADSILTDTFHGTILSIITHRKFATLVRKSGYGNSEKLIDLLERLKLKDRIVSNEEAIPELLDTPIDYNDTDRIIKQERERSYEYLRKQIEAGV